MMMQLTICTLLFKILDQPMSVSFKHSHTHLYSIYLCVVKYLSTLPPAQLLGVNSFLLIWLMLFCVLYFMES